MRLAIIGYGALGRYIEDMITEAYPVDRSEIVYFDDQRHAAGAERSRPFAAHTSDEFRDLEFYVCLGYKHLRIKQQIIDRLLELGRKVPSFVHPSAYVHPSVRIGSGSMVYPGCSIDRNTAIGNGAWIANADVIAHDCTIGDCCWFGASVTLSGMVAVAARTFIGSGSVVSNNIEIGSNVIIGLGTVVTKPVGDNLSVIGNPMRILERPLVLR
ncbi:MAG TPA: acetyltransferase [Kofleriaceae bacterium]|nr:acetyltransferase [Kofleriaceae bacterium]